MDYIAHIGDKSTSITQTVAQHSSCVSKKAVNYAKDISCENIAKIQGLLHDSGKLTKEFTEYITQQNNLKRGDIDHSFAGAKYLYTLAKDGEDKSVATFIARTIISHHGLHDWIDDSGNDYFMSRTAYNKNYNEIVQNIPTLIKEDKLLELLDNAQKEYSHITKDILSTLSKNGKNATTRNTMKTFYFGMFERFMQSILIDSDRTDTADFMSNSQTEKVYDTQKLWETMQENMLSKLKSFEDKTDKISLQRKSISDRCKDFAKNDVKICRLVVPTGGGKTLSSLRFAIDYAKRKNCKKIIYVAPFMSILEQNSDVIRNIAGEENFLEHHSNFKSNIDTKEELNNYELHTEKWDSPVIATTMVQFLNALFDGKNGSVRRMHRLANSVIIIDEVQSIPLKCVNMFNLSMNFLTNVCGSSVVLCSATQPVFEKTDYPLLIDKNESMTGDYSSDFDIFKRVKIINKITKAGMNCEQIAEFCIEKCKENGNLLLVVNTKSVAKTIYENIVNIKENVEVVHLSANMCPEHRRKKIKHIKDSLAENKPIICVTTQLIEAGVDISFKCVVRSLAGLDNLAQASGRCNRNGESDKLCPVYLVNLANENLGKLKDIQTAKDIFHNFISDKEYSDYLATKTISRFFEKLYIENTTKLSYIIDEKKEETLLDRLSLNKSKYELYKGTESYYSGDRCSPLNAQAFKTAGTYFEVIDKNTQSIIVPYDDSAKRLIEQLDSETDLSKISDLLRQSQKYVVNIYANTNKQLRENNAIRELKNGALALEDRFYNDECGVVTSGAEQEILIF